LYYIIAIERQYFFKIIGNHNFRASNHIECQFKLKNQYFIKKGP